MLGMVLSVVGNCMRSVEPARKNLIEDPELVTEANEEPSSSSASSASSVNSRHGLQEGCHQLQQEERGGGVGVVALGGVNNNLYIIEEYSGVEENSEDRNRDAVVSVSSHGSQSPILTSSEVAHVHSSNYHYHRNNNNNYNKNNKNSKIVAKNGSGHVDRAVKGSTTNKRPLVLVCKPHKETHPNHHHHHHKHHNSNHNHSHHGSVTAGG